MIEIHAFTAENGHNLSTDCWCEPNRIVVSKLKDGVTPCLIVEHEDTTLLHHLDVVRSRHLSVDAPFEANPEAAWITRVLNDLKEPERTDNGEFD